MSDSARPRTFAIIPAAGRSARMGRPKLLLPWGQTTVLEQVLAAWKASRVDQIILVIHPEDIPLAVIGAAAGVHVVRPDVPPPDMKDSVRLGLEHAARRFEPTPRDAWLMAPADMPELSVAAIDRLIASYVARRDDSVAPPRVWAIRDPGGRRGHPVLFAWPMADEVASLAANEGINALVDRHKIEYVSALPDELGEDLDTPEDYERLRPRSSP